MLTKRLGSIALAVMLGITMVACGGDDDKASTEATTTTEGSNGDDLDLSAFTEECAELTQVFAGAYASIGAGLGGEVDKELEDAAKYFDKVAGNLPKEIRADFEIFAQAYADFATAMAQADIDFSDPTSIDPEKLKDFEKLSDALSDPEVEKASANVEAYLTAKCGDG